MRRANLFSVDTAQDDGDPKGYEVPYARIGELIGAARMGLSVYDLAPGNSICPYHWEFPDEEWLIVLAGRPTLRIPDGEHELEAGDVVCFPPGPDGAHKVTNKGEEPVRVAMLSTKAEQNVFPLRKIHRIDDAVDYWDGEL
jgi:uncharacterized cupin superfamily protein